MLDLDTDQHNHSRRRQAALHHMKESFERFTKGLHDDISAAAISTRAKNAIKTHPWAAAGAALGAGMIAGKMLTSHSSSKPQHVVVEVQHNGHVAPAAPAAAKHSTLLGTIFGMLSSMGLTSLAIWQPLIEQFMGHLTPTPSVPNEAERPENPAATDSHLGAVGEVL